MSQRTVMLVGLSPLIAALTPFVSRRFGFSFLCLTSLLARGRGTGS